MKNFVILGFMVLALNACGFKPLHGDQKTFEKLAGIKINVTSVTQIPDKFVHRLRSVIEDTFQMGNNPQQIQYILNVNVTKVLASYETQNNTSSRTRISLYIHLNLKDIVTDKNIYTDKLIAIDSFQVADSPYSALVTEEETAIRMTKEIANEIELRVLRKLGV